ncbi:XRE family transcriptional regulator [Aliishimia ponticola]|uniref:XRE family transcriptional regulator n=1 Tax=Aliishimia ponticola TaxID=2499833 RepID=A0A4S4N9B4_9RHOB|nr:helix-turn-helix transcriptional regulator [Aliishimia ponticola]THH35832.1 XRE family transcriptional regulator [Aliishimia ponticola]
MAHVVDIHVGKRVRQRRWLLGLTQQQLGEAVGIKFQQVQKYETGANRVSASRLWEIAKVLEVPVTFFFEGLDVKKDGRAASSVKVPEDPTQDREAMELMRAYFGIPEPQRKRLFELARVLSDVP